MYFKRVTECQGTGFIRCMVLYCKSFPQHEQRMAESQRCLMTDPRYHMEQIIEDDRFLGALFYWEADDFLYVEHFCMEPQVREQGFGQKALELLAEKGKPVILEIDPPVDDLSRRRKGFYERCGFQENGYTHIHPAYRPGYSGHELVVMSAPRALTQMEYDRFFAYLRDTVMAV